MGDEESTSSNKVGGDVVVVAEEEGNTSTKAGGWKSMPYIIGNETFEKLASLSLVANLVVYLKTQFNMDAISSATTYSIWSGSCNLAPLLGAYVADAHLGKFKTLIFGSITSSVGMATLALTAGIPALRPPTCPSLTDCEEPNKLQLGVLYTGLGLLVIGAGGIRPCNIAFGVDQFDVTTEKGKDEVKSFYNWYYLSFTISLLVALTVVVYIQNSISWTWGLIIPAMCMLLSVVVFLLGRKLYVYTEPKGSVFVNLAMVIVAAFRKRKLKGSQHTLYDPINSDPEANTKHPHTKKFKCLEKAAVITDQDMFDARGVPTNGWRLCSVQHVEELKSLICILPIWVSGLTSFIIMDQQNTFGVQQALQMNRHVTKKFEVPPGSMGLTSMIALALYIITYERGLFPLSKKFSRNGITLKQRMIAGILVSILCMVTSALVERRRLGVARENGSALVVPMSFLWLLPQFGLGGLIEGLTSIALLEFFNSRLPERMRTLGNAFVYLNLSIAGYLNTAMVNAINDSTIKWLGGRDLNKNRLDYYYYLIAGLGLLNLVYFLTFAGSYLDSISPSEEKGNASETVESRRLEDGQHEKIAN